LLLFERWFSTAEQRELFVVGWGEHAEDGVPATAAYASPSASPRYRTAIARTMSASPVMPDRREKHIAVRPVGCEPGDERALEQPVEVVGSETLAHTPKVLA
jgi:hypothetical protein